MSTHPRDISSVDLEAMSALTPYADELRALVDCARRHTGFFPAHNPRALEYPWVLATLPASVEGLRILDVGAGINPLPFALAERGARVTTLDNHPLTRDLQTREQWNEWGFLDYSLLDARISSVRAAYERFDNAAPFDCILSVSVIEHLPGSVRREWVRKFSEQLVGRGRLVLTVDLVPETNSLWNLAEGKVIEPLAEHGELSTLVEELGLAGFTVSPSVISRQIPDSRVDVGFISATKK